MQKFLSAFRRERSGTWVCISGTEFEGPNGRLQTPRGARFVKGALYMGVDMAKLLEEEYSREQRADPRPA